MIEESWTPEEFLQAEENYNNKKRQDFMHHIFKVDKAIEMAHIMGTTYTVPKLEFPKDEA